MTTQTVSRESITSQFLSCYTQQPTGEEFTPEQKELLRSFARDKPLVFLAFPLKVGGTFLRTAIAGAIQIAGNQKPVRLVRGSFMGNGDGERDLYLPNLLGHFLSVDDGPAILHNHTTATLSNRVVMDLFGMKPVVMKRNILDILRSFYDAGSSKGHMKGHGSGFAEDETFFDQPLDIQKDYLVSNVAPWYVKFFASWMLAEQRGQIPAVHWTSFDEFRQDAAPVVQGILEYYQIDVTPEAARTGVEAAKSQRKKLRFNKGTSGRGEQFFNAEQIAHVERLTQSFTSLDFRAQGLI
ncbi:MAG: hypothetical protein ACI841_003738 [Planctomycetota bacterium]|jgi:hypothetical protein